ncbi:unnamed protein product, partial [Ectocarpus fasciculatus]
VTLVAYLRYLRYGGGVRACVCVHLLNNVLECWCVTARDGDVDGAGRRLRFAVGSTRFSPFWVQLTRCVVVTICIVGILEERSHRSKSLPLPESEAIASPGDGLYLRGGGSGRRVQMPHGTARVQVNSNNGCSLFRARSSQATLWLIGWMVEVDRR